MCTATFTPNDHDRHFILSVFCVTLETVNFPDVMMVAIFKSERERERERETSYPFSCKFEFVIFVPVHNDDDDGPVTSVLVLSWWHVLFEKRK